MMFLIFLLAYPSTFGGKGIYRVKGADLEWLLDEKSVLVINIDAEGYRYDYTTRDTFFDYGSGRIGIAYTPTHLFEGYTLWRIHGQGRTVTPISESDWQGDMGDIDIGGKHVIKKMRNSYLSGDLSLTLPIGREGYSNERLIVYPKILGTFDFGDYWDILPVRINFNLGVPFGRQGLSDNFPVLMGFALDLHSKYFTYFMEVSRNHERDWNWRVTPGLKFHFFYRFCVTVAADLGMVTDYRLLGVNGGISLNSSLTREREILPSGVIAGEVRDRGTNDPLPGTAEVLEMGERVKADANGVYKIFGVPKGVYTLRVTSPDYGDEIRVVSVEADRPTLANFQLLRYQAMSRGFVLDVKTREPLANATVILEGKTRAELTTGFDGEFESILLPGDYDIKVNKENYVLYAARLTVYQNRTDTIWLKPVEVLAETPEAVIYFDFGDANIRDDQKPTLDKIAEFLKSQPRVKCELRGHTDPVGDIQYNEILSLARANSVMDYLVKVHGIEKERIATMAFSKTKLIKGNDEQSRRVEIFLIK
jgi:outer membrane protein OmpA-like peptidoglycan-associated protein